MASLLVALCMLTSAAIAHGASSWVVWVVKGEGRFHIPLFTHETVESCNATIDPQRPTARAWVLWWRSTQDWRVMAAYETRDGGEAKARAQTSRTAEFLRQLKEEEKSVLGGKTLPDIPVAFDCLPDTVDPHGPKGK
ncbi:MAG: hypothetical protein DMD96_21235 [Candidatus Rokuibacteriota bacterium]|nr:MAG: hypothetical protein DMD96_21235 [Candidatus Rokubacteria bacterium]